MSDFNFQNSLQFLQGFLKEQDRAKAEKKVQNALKDGKYEVSYNVNPVTGEVQYSVKPKQQPIPGFIPKSQTVNGVNYMNPNVEGKPSPESLRWKAQQEAYRRLGGSMMVGISEKRREQYKQLQETLYQQYLKEYGVGFEESIEEPLIEEDYGNTNW